MSADDVAALKEQPQSGIVEASTLNLSFAFIM